MADKPLNYNELLKKAEEKRNTKILAGQKIKEECDLSKIITVDSSKELALLTHYNSFPEVEVESNINDFWNSQQSKLKSIEQKMVQPSDKYVNLVEKLLAIRENRDSRISSSKGTNNFNEQRKEALESLKKAKEQQEKVMNDDKANPFEIMFQLIGLNNEKFEERDIYRRTKSKF